jgi:cytochrome c-type biogenesis protein CcmH/NrfG
MSSNYKSAMEPLQRSLKYDPNQVKSYLYLGMTALRTGDLDGADYNYKKALGYFPNSFDANIGLTETMYRKGTFGSAYLQAETSKSKADNDTQMAQVLYWRALSQEGRKSFGDAIKDWRTLLALPETATTADMRQTAEEHLRTLSTLTPTPKGGIPTATPSRTPKPSGSGTPTPTRTPTPTP